MLRRRVTRFPPGIVKEELAGTSSMVAALEDAEGTEAGGETGGENGRKDFIDFIRRKRSSERKFWTDL